MTRKNKDVRNNHQPLEAARATIAALRKEIRLLKRDHREELRRQKRINLEHWHVLTAQAAQARLARVNVPARDWRKMEKLFHPDSHPTDEQRTEASQIFHALRDQLTSKSPPPRR